MGRRQKLMFAVRIVVSVVMLALLLTRVHLSSLLPQDRSSAVPWLAAGILVMGAAMVLATLRWQRVLTALELPADLSHLVSYSLAAMFVANFLPSTIGGDVLRVARLSARNGQAPASFASVVLERLTGFLVLPLITLIALLTHPDLLRLGTASRVAVLFSLGTLGALVVILCLAANTRLGQRLAANDSWLRFAGAVHLGFHRVRRHPGAAASVLLTAVAYQLTIVLGAWLASRAVGIDVGFFVVMAFIPVVAMAQVLPVSVNGLGLREGALVLLLQPLGVPTGQAVALGLVLYALNLLVSLLGAPAFAVGVRRPLRAAA